MSGLLGKRVLVTGGSRGLGRAIVVALARAGARVGFTFRSRVEDAEETRRLAGEGTLVFQGDVADAAHASATVAACVAAWGGLDGLVCNAAVVQIVPMAMLEEADWDACMNTNVKGTYLFARAALRPMIKARAGRIVCVGSLGGSRVLDAPVHYAASKAALAGFVAALAKEVGRYGVGVQLLQPGLLESGLSARLPKHRVDAYRAQAALGRLGGLDEVAAAATWLLSDEAALLTGMPLVIDGGL